MLSRSLAMTPHLTLAWGYDGLCLYYELFHPPIDAYTPVQRPKSEAQGRNHGGHTHQYGGEVTHIWTDSGAILCNSSIT